MTKSFKYIFLFSCVLFSCFNVNSQKLEYSSTLNLEVGNGNVKGIDDSNIFFPNDFKQNQLLMAVNYHHKLMKWLDGGVIVSFSNLEQLDAQTNYAAINATGEKIFAIGPSLLFHSPFEKLGWLNKLRIGVRISPQYSNYSGERALLIDNEYVPLDGQDVVMTQLTMDSGNGWGWVVDPELNYRISQSWGFTISYHLKWYNINTGYGDELLHESALVGGLVFYLGKSKQLYW